MATTHQNQDFSQNYYPNYPQCPTNYYGQYYNQNHSYMDNGNYNQNNYQQMNNEHYQHLHNSNSYGYNGHHQSYNGLYSNFYNANSGIEHQNELNKNLITPQVPVQEEVKKESRKRKNISESSNDDSPALRFLLTNPQKKLKYTPSYSIHGFKNQSPAPRVLEVKDQSIIPPYQDKIFNEFLDRSPYCERDSPISTDFYKPVCNKKPTETILLSPNRTEDSLDFNEYTPKMDSHSVKDGYESMPQQFYNNISGIQSATGVGTPPLSPKEAGPLNGDKSAMSSPTSLNYNWMNGCESGNFLFFFELFLKIWLTIFFFLI